HERHGVAPCVKVAAQSEYVALPFRNSTVFSSRSLGASIHGFMPIHADPGVVFSSYLEMAAHVQAGRLLVEVERRPLSDVGCLWGESARHKIVLVP
ncbi:MAG: hypothetical protein ABIS86_18320, partial [Streptosporangiaceae bacterium]